ncbi:MAG: M24 family metallopeptidase [Brevefilum sp.]
MHTQRLKKLTDLMAQYGLAGMALNPGPTMTYLTGMHFHLMERPTVLLISQAGLTAMVLPGLEKGKLPPSSEIFEAFTYDDDPATWPLAFEQAGEWLHLEQGEIGVVSTRMRFLELQYLESALHGVDFVDGSLAVAGLRMQKEPDEVGKMRTAAEIAQKAMYATLKSVKEGMTEKEIANRLVIELLKAGSEPHLPFSPIVAIGENSANPHAVPTSRRLQRGDLLLVDWGASFEGYFSDITRTFTFGDVDPELIRIGEIVLEANQAGRLAARPGVDAGAVDRAARSIITAAGYGSAFIHRTGHGLGMEAHEPPYIFEENDLILAPGMTFTVEPGIYLTRKGGVRIEDDVVVTSQGSESLTDFPRRVRSVEDFKG